MAKKSKIFAATRSAKERLAKGEYKKRCAKGCACGTLPAKQDTGGGGIPKGETAAIGQTGATDTAPAKK